MKYRLAALFALFALPALASDPVDLSFLAGDFAIHDPAGAEIGEAAAIEEAADAVIRETRKVGDGAPQILWFVNDEEKGGWRQLFVAATGRVRAFDPVSAAGEWPLVLGSETTLKDGTTARFRMTLSKTGDDRARRLLEMSKDDGATWTTVFDYDYRRRE